MVLLESTFFGGSVLTSTCCASRSLIVGGFLFAALLGGASSPAARAAVRAAAVTLPLRLGRASFIASPSACRSQRGRRSTPIHSAPESGKWRCVASDLRVRGWR